MEQELYIENLERNKKIITSSKLDSNIVILKKYDSNAFIITKNNLSKINTGNYNNTDIIIDGSIFDIYNDKAVLNVERNNSALLKNRFKNIYLIQGNKVVKKCFDIIKNLIDKYDIDTDKIFIINHHDNTSYFINDLFNLIKAYKLKGYDRYSFIYDTVCDELDRRYRLFNLCDFKNNVCARKRELIDKYNDEMVTHGCCYTKGKVCDYFKDGNCSIKSIGCKFFACNYLIKKGIIYKPSDFLLIKEFFNIYDINVIYNKLYSTKKDTLKLIINESK